VSLDGARSRIVPSPVAESLPINGTSQKRLPQLTL
jgi:hypothetical protein